MSFTIAVIKPDAIEANKMGEIISIIEKSTLNIHLVKHKYMTQHNCALFYKEHKDKDFFERLTKGMVGYWLVIHLHSYGDAVTEWREAMKPIRDTYRSKELHKNAVHGSDSKEAEIREYEFFFRESYEG